MAMSTEVVFKIAATQAAERWKEPQNRTEALRGQIVDTFRVCKRLQERAGVTGMYSAVIGPWKQAFEAIGCPTEFNFNDGQQIG
jgi:hypothetical protein